MQVLLLGVLLLCPFFGVVLEKVHRVPFWLKPDDVALGQVEGSQQPQRTEQHGGHLYSRLVLLEHSSIGRHKENDRNKVGDHGKGDGPGDIVFLGGRLHHECAEERKERQDAIVPMDHAQEEPRFDLALDKSMGGQKHVVLHQAGSSTVDIPKAEQTFHQEAQGHDGPGSPLDEGVQGGSAAVGEVIHQHDLECLDQDGGETDIEAQSKGGLLHLADDWDGPADVEAGAEAHQD